jgi:nitroimidazol reductase NimA-like FMN-containing flavoprotein (pyridoxamine 5'-phosphate oxidase superfamily)
MSRRSSTPMSQEAAYSFLDSKPGWLTLTSIGRDGYPHSVTIGYFRLEDDLICGCLDNTQKVRNIERNPKVSALVESTQGSHLRGVMVQGDATIVRDDAARLELARAAARRRGVPEDQLPASPSPRSVYIRIRCQRRISWEYT